MTGDPSQTALKTATGDAHATTHADDGQTANSKRFEDDWRGEHLIRGVRLPVEQRNIGTVNLWRVVRKLGLKYKPVSR
jgi:hypothetical protein